MYGASWLCHFLVACTPGEESNNDKPLLQLLKNVAPTAIIEKDSTAVQIIVFNAGGAPAYQVQVVDELQGDKYGKEIEKIDPGQTVLVGYRKKLEKLGDVRLEPAVAFYHLDLEADSKVYHAYSTLTNEELTGELQEKLPLAHVLTAREYSKKHRYYAKEIATTVLLSILTTCLPFAIYKRNAILLNASK